MSFLFSFINLLLGCCGLLGFFRYLSTRLNEKDESKDVFSAAAALLLSPVVTSMILWAEMVLFPGKFSLRSLGFSVVAINVLLAVVFGKYAVAAIKDLWHRYVSFWRNENIIWGIPLGIAAVVMMLLFSGVLASNISVQNFDMIEYVIGGDHFANTRSIIYNGYFINEKNGFIYFTYHSFCMPLFATFGVFLHETTGLPQDWYIKFINGYFWTILNIIVAFFLFHRKKERGWTLPICGMILINGIPIIGDRLISFGIDFFRISCLTAGIGILWTLVKKPSVFKAILSVFLLSVAAAAHILGACIVPFFCFLPMAIQGTWQRKIIYTLSIGFSVLLIGYLHYFLQILCGDGWLFAIPSEVTSMEFTAFQKQTLLQQIMKGYLGILFNLEFYSFASITAGILFLSVFKKLKSKFAIEHKLFCVFLFIAALLLTIRGHANYRYGYTIFYLMFLSMFVCVLKENISRRMRIMALFATGITVLYSAWVAWTHLYDIKTYAGIAQNASRIQKVLYSTEELFKMLGKEQKSNVALWGKNKLLMRNSPLPLCYVRSDGRINWETYKNDIFSIKYLPHDTFETIMKKNFSHVIVDKNSNIRKNMKAAILKDAKFLCETKSHIVFRLNPL